MKTVSHTAEFEVACPVDELFPLFSPEGEKLWVPDWDYEKVTDGDLAEDYVFLTRAHDHAAADAIWIVKRYEPTSHLVEFYKVEPGEKVGLVRVRCEGQAFGSTKVEVTYTYTALSRAAEHFVAGFDDDAYVRFIDEWRRLLTKYLSS